MNQESTRQTTLMWLLTFYSLFSWSAACIDDSDCYTGYGSSSKEKCCHGTCIDEDATCLSGGAIAGIVIGCLIVGGIILSTCLCFCCACGPFQNTNQGTVIRYGGQTTTTATTSYPTASVQATYGASYPQPASANYPSSLQGQAAYPPQPGSAHPNALHGQPRYPSAVQVQAGYQAQPGGKPYPPPNTAPPSYDEATVPPPYNPKYPQTQ